jgi:hypothetical protein
VVVHRTLYRALLACLALLLVAGLSSAAGPAYRIGRWTVDGGGGTLRGGGYTLSGTAGQADAGQPLRGGGYTLGGGFWAGGEAASGPMDDHVFLPAVLRGAP